MIQISGVLDFDAGAILDIKFPGVVVDPVGYTVCTGGHIQRSINKCC
jgi:hypothetical protein